MDIYKYINEQISNYPTNTVDRDGHSFNQYHTLKKITAYIESRYLSGKYDALGRRKPFYNINGRLLNKQRTAEDIDTKDIQLTTTKPDHYAKSLLMTVANKKWMKKVNFAKTLNEMTKKRGEHGGVLVKKVMKDGILDIDVIDLTKIITDPTDIESGVKIDPQVYNIAELLEMKKTAGWGMGEFEGSIEESINTLKKNNRENGENTEYITVYVVDGVLPRTFVDPEADELDFSNQMHVITLDNNGGDVGQGVTLFSAERKENVYKYLPYLLLSDRSLGMGVVEASFEAQESINEAKINERNALDIASRAIFQQPEGASTARNIYTDMVDGDFLEYTSGPAGLLNATPSSLGYHKNVIEDWKGQISDQSSVLDANTGNMPASTTFRGMALQNQEANSVFELRREEMGIFIREIYTDWVIPFLKKWVKKQEFIEGELSSTEMQRVLEDYAYKKARTEVDSKYFDGAYNDLPAGQKFAQMSLDTEIQKDLIMQDLPKDKLWLKSGDKYLDGVEFDLDILITGEQRDKQVFVSNKVDLFNAYNAVADRFNTDPNVSTKLNEIAEALGMKPFEINEPTEQQQAPQEPQEIEITE